MAKQQEPPLDDEQADDEQAQMEMEKAMARYLDNFHDIPVVEAAPQAIRRKTPGEWAAEGDPYDCTGEIGQLGEDGMCAWPMYSYDAPAYTVWNAIAATFNRAGWSDDQIRDWLQSKHARWAMDGELGAVLRAAGEAYARKVLKEKGG
jgi:hypothetical protein